MSRKRALDETAAIGDGALACLEEDGWLTDDVINAFFARISERFPSTYVFSSFFMSKLHGPAGYSYDAVRRWTRQTHIFGKALLLIPTYQRRARHWCLIVADMRSRILFYFDPLRRRSIEGDAALISLLRYFADEWAEKHPRNTPFSTDKWRKLTSFDDIPRQPDGDSCGVFCCVFAARLTGAAMRTPLSHNVSDVLHDVKYVSVQEMRDYVRATVVSGLPR